MVLQQTFSAMLITSVSFALSPSFANGQNAIPTTKATIDTPSVISSSEVSPKSLGTNDGEAWEALADMPAAPRECGGGVIDGKFYVVADGYTAVYDPALDTWDDTLPSMPTNRRGHGAGCTLDGKLYVMGGEDPTFFPMTLDTNEVYDPATNSWSTMQSMPTSMYSGVIVPFDGKIYRIDFQATEVYDPALDDGPGGQNAWTSKEAPSSSSIGQFCDAAVVDGKIYIFGGNFSAALVYDPAKDDGPGGETAWSTVAAIPTNRNWLRTIPLNGKIHALGGNLFTGGASDVHEIYDPVTDTWSVGPPNLRSRLRFAAGVIDHSIYIAGGTYFDASGSVGTNSLERYTETIPEPTAAKNWTFY